MKWNGSMYNRYNKNKTDDLGGQQKSEEGTDFYIPIGAILVDLDCPKNIVGIEPIGPDFNNRICVCAIEVLEGEEGR
jgi:hypothetical protein